MKLSLFYFIILSVLFYGCIKDDDMCGAPEPDEIFAELDSLGLPPATMTGENTFGCLINGEPWLPLKTNFLGGLDYHIPFSINGDGFLSIQGVQDYDSLRTTLSFGVTEVLSSGDYNTIGGGFTDHNDDYLGNGYDIDLSFTESEVIITHLDFEEGIVSGTFNFMLIDDNIPSEVPFEYAPADTLWITNGRFDLGGS